MRWSRPAWRLRPAASRQRCSLRSKRSRAPRAGSSSSASAMARRSSSTTRTSRTRWRRRSRRCGPTRKQRLVVVFGCGRRPRRGQAPADGRDRRRRRPTGASSPTTIRAAKTRRRSAREILAAAPGAREIGDRARGDPAAPSPRWNRRCAADRRQGPRDRPDRRRRRHCRSATTKAVAAALKETAA